MRIRTRRLPAGYNELEYIESTGTQWIDTGLAVNYNYKVSLTMYQEKNVEAWQQLFGIRGYGAQIGLYAKRIDANVVCYDYVNRSSYVSRDQVFPLKKIHKVLVDKNKVYVDDSLIFQVAEQSFGYTTQGLFLLAYNSSEGSRDPFQGRLYDCSIWDNGTLARKFIPCERISDGKPGLYDAVNNTFYINAGTGEFVKGPYASCSYQASLTSLPSGYQEVEYIESTGTQWFDSGVPVAEKTAIDCKIQWTDISGSYPMLYGVWSNYSLSSMPSGKLCIASGGYSGNNPWNAGPTVAANVEYNIFHKQNKISINGVEYAIPNAGSSNSATNRHIIMFAASALDQVDTPYNWSTYCKCKMYYLKILDNDSVVRYFIPCHRKSDNVIGMWDAVHGKFYTNQGTGTFLKGDDVVNSRGCAPRLGALPTTYQGVEYIQGSGTQFIKTTYIPTASTSIDVQFMVTSTQTSGGGWEQITGEKTAYHSTSSFQVAFCTLSGTSNNHLGLDYGQANDLAATTLPGIDRNVIINVKMTPDNWIVNNTHVIPHNYSLSGTGIPIWIFDCNKANTNERPFIGRIYFYKIYENNQLMHNFLPCYRKSDDVIGLYDTVDKQFYVNQGTGTFEKGADKNHIW